ncbi:MAG: septum formation initiator family protein [Candidatus Omnitrophica bacterium]|nr:septum formation initiator family protein [Candidatus Omnitrophota bacterium]
MREKLFGKIDSLTLLRFGALLLALGLLGAIVYFPTYSHLQKLRKENKRIESDIEQLHDEITEYEQMLKGIRENPDYFEKIARENLGVIKDNEIIIDIQE